MAQFDVLLNPGANRAVRPYVLVVQSARFDDTRRRLVAPLVLLDKVPIPETEITPHFTVAGQDVALITLELIAVDIARLGPKVGSLREEATRIITAIDEVLTTAYG